jgi:hypothetical protein
LSESVLCYLRTRSTLHLLLRLPLLPVRLLLLEPCRDHLRLLFNFAHYNYNT